MDEPHPGHDTSTDSRSPVCSVAGFTVNGINVSASAVDGPTEYSADPIATPAACSSTAMLHVAVDDVFD